MLASYDADQQIYWYHRNREMTNFPHFFYKTEVEMELNAVRARKGFYEAEQLRRAGKREQALQKYADMEAARADCIPINAGRKCS